MGDRALQYGYTSNLSLEAMDDDDVLVAWQNHGEDLEPEHGWPLRLVVPKRYAWKSAKWLTGLEFVDKNKRGFWEVRGYHVHAEPFGEERYSYQEGPRPSWSPSRRSGRRARTRVRRMSRRLTMPATRPPSTTGR